MDVRMVPLATVAGGFEAKVLVARLGAEGVLCELRGESDNVYPFSRVEILVPADEIDLARELLAAPPVSDDDWAEAFPVDEQPVEVAPTEHAFAFVHRRGVALLVLASTSLFVAVRLLALG